MDKVIDVVDEIMLDPFKVSDTGLVYIVSGRAANEKIVTYLPNDYETGKQAYNSFSDSINSDEIAIFVPCKRLNLETFESSDKRKKRKDKSGAEISERKLFSRMILLGKQLNINLRELLSYSLGTISYPLSTSDGSLAKT